MVYEDNRALEIPAWEKLLACGRGGRGIQCGLIILLLRCLNKRDGAAARIIQLYPPFAMICPISYRLGSLRLTLLFPRGRGLKLARLFQRVRVGRCHGNCSYDTRAAEPNSVQKCTIKAICLMANNRALVCSISNINCYTESSFCRGSPAPS